MVIPVIGNNIGRDDRRPFGHNAIDRFVIDLLHFGIQENATWFNGSLERTTTILPDLGIEFRSGIEIDCMGCVIDDKHSSFPPMYFFNLFSFFDANASIAHPIFLGKVFFGMLMLGKLPDHKTNYQADNRSDDIFHFIYLHIFLHSPV